MNLNVHVDDRWNGFPLREMIERRAKERLAGRELPGRAAPGALRLVPLNESDHEEIRRLGESRPANARAWADAEACVERDSFVVQSFPDRVEIRAAGPRGLLYGVYELIERLRRGEDISALKLIETPALPLRVNHEYLTISQRLSRAANREEMERFFTQEAFYLRWNGLCPVANNGRALLPVGFPTYESRRCVPGECFEEMRFLYEQCVRYDLDFYYPINIIPAPVEFETMNNTQALTTRISNLENWLAGDSMAALAKKYPEFFDEAGRIDFHHPAFANMTVAEVLAALEHFPKLAGFHIFACETGGHSYQLSAFRPDLPYVDELMRFIKLIDEAVPANLRLMFFKHGSNIYPEIAHELSRRCKESVPRLIFIDDVHIGPQYPGRVVYAIGGSTPEERRRYVGIARTAAWLLMDSEHIGWGDVEFCLPGYYYETMSTSIDYGIMGLAGRTRRDYGDVIGRLLEGNAYVGSRAAWNPGVEGKRSFREWLASFCGSEPPSELEEILSDHEAIFRNGFLVQGFQIFDLVANIEEEERILAWALYKKGMQYPSTLDRFQPPGERIFPKLRNTRHQLVTREMDPVAKSSEELRQEKRRALELVERGLERLAQLEGRLPEPVYRAVYRNQENMRDAVRLTALLVDAFIEESELRRECTPERIASFRAAVDKLEDEAYRVRCEKGITFFYGLARGAMNYAQIARRRVDVFAIQPGVFQG